MAEQTSGHNWNRIGPCLLMLSGVSALTLAIVVPTYLLGKNVEDDRQFLRNYRPPTDWEFCLEAPMEYARDSTEANDVAFVGGSSCVCGIDTNQFTRLTNLTAYNLGASALIGIEGYNVILQAYLKHHPMPRMVVACLSFWELDKQLHELGPAEFRERFFWCYGPGTEDTRPPHPEGNRYYVRQGFWFLLGKVTGGLEPRLQETMQGQKDVRDTYRARQERRKEYHGYFPFPDQIMGGQLRPNGAPDPPYTVNAVNRDGFRQLARICRENKIPLLIRLAPVFEGDAPRNWDVILAWLTALKCEYPATIIPKPEVILFEERFFYDRLHCNPKGATRFTALVADDVKAAYAVSDGYK